MVLQVLAIEDGMTVQQIAWTHNAHQEVDGAQALMGRVVIVMDAEGGRVGNQHVQPATEAQFVPQQAWQHVVNAHVHAELRILVGCIKLILDTAAQPGKEKSFHQHALLVKVFTSMRPRARVVGIIGRVVIAGHV